jgi:hypothetical protein
MPEPRTLRYRRTSAPTGYGWTERLRETRSAAPREDMLPGGKTAAQYMEQARRTVDAEEKALAKQRDAAEKERKRQANMQFENEARRTNRPIFKNEVGDWQFQDTDEDWQKQQALNAQNAEREAQYRREGRQFFKDKTTGAVVPEIDDDTWTKRKAAQQALDDAERVAREAEAKQTEAARWESVSKSFDDAKLATTKRRTSEAKKRFEQADRDPSVPQEVRETLRAEWKQLEADSNAEQGAADERAMAAPMKAMEGLKALQSINNTQADLKRLGEDLKTGRSPDWYTPQKPAQIETQPAPPDLETLNFTDAQAYATRAHDEFNAEVEHHNAESERINGPLLAAQQRLDAIRQENAAAITAGGPNLIQAEGRDEQGNSIPEAWDPNLFQQYRKAWQDACNLNSRRSQS